MFCLLWIFGEDFKAGKVTGKHSGKKGVFKWHLPQPVKVESEANLDGMRKEIHFGDEVQGYFLPCTSWKTLLFLVDFLESVYFARGEVVRWSDDVDYSKGGNRPAIGHRMRNIGISSHDHLPAPDQPAEFLRLQV